uniref:Calcium voltage-gated channel auxiliary subunit alpha2delta 4 n=1 Tax=Varanus komodoensis TaxID=61221 RepID=A0A8D2LWP6_VARKO
LFPQNKNCSPSANESVGGLALCIHTLSFRTKIFLVLFSLSNHPSFSCLLFSFCLSISAHKHKKHDTLQPCDTEYPIFVYEPAIKETNGIIECKDCQKMFVVQQITNSNLLSASILSFPKPAINLNNTTHNASVKCDRMRSQKLRRRPDTCHAFHPEENAQDCGGAAEISSSLTLLLLSLGATALLLR